MAAWCVEGTEHIGTVCVRTSRVRPTGKCEIIELSDGCELGAGPDVAVPFDSCVRDKGCVVDVEQAVIPPCGPVGLRHILLFFHLRTDKWQRQTPKSEMLQRAKVCAGSEM